MREHRALFFGLLAREIFAEHSGAQNRLHVSPSDLQRYYDQYYTPANMSIVGVGGVNLSQLVDLLAASPFAVEKWVRERHSLCQQVTWLCHWKLV